MTEFEIISLIVGMATATGISYSIIHGIIRDGQERKSREKHDNLEFVKILNEYENQMFKISSRWQNSDKNSSDTLRFTRSFIRQLDGLAFLQQNKKIDSTLLDYFKADFLNANTCLQWLIEFELNTVDNYPYFQSWVHKKQIGIIQINESDAEFFLIRKMLEKSHKEFESKMDGNDKK